MGSGTIKRPSAGACPARSRNTCHPSHSVQYILAIQTEIAVSTADIPLSRATAGRYERGFYTGMALASALAVFVGFASSYYLKPLNILRPFSAAAPLSPLVHVHAVAFSAWVILFVAQVRLVAARRLALHRRLGVGGVVLAAVMLALGTLTMIAGARRGGTAPFGLTTAQFMIVPMVDLIVFGTMVTFAVVFRRRSAVHKRLMLLALTGGLLPAPLARLGLYLGFPPLFPLLMIAFLAAGVVYDRKTVGRVHFINRWVPLAIFLTVPLRILLARTDAWHALALGIIG